jgi:hypothetical protein
MNLITKDELPGIHVSDSTLNRAKITLLERTDISTLSLMKAGKTQQ